MKKLPVVIILFLLIGLISCTTNHDPVNSPASADTSKEDSIHITAPQEINKIENLLPQLPLLKFPLLLDVEELKSKKIIPLTFDKNLEWFAQSSEFPEETKIAAVGKFYLDLKVIAVVFLVTSPGESERPDDQQLILAIVNTETGAVNSRTVATANAEDYGRTIMKTPEEGKSFMQFESEDITITFREFGIVDEKFIPDKSEIKTFAGNQKGADAAELAIKKWMK
ncbi:MAG: hypothetical protein ABIQ40_01400 [Bacteroidia bacterium]